MLEPWRESICRIFVPASTKNQAQRPYEIGLLMTFAKKQDVFSHGFCENLEVWHPVDFCRSNPFQHQVVVCGRFWVYFLARFDGSMKKAL